MNFTTQTRCCHLTARIIALLLAASAGRCLAQNVQSDATTTTYVGSRVCAGCHEPEATKWNTSHHAGAWRLPEPATVFGDFSDKRLNLPTHEARFRNRDGGYFIELEDASGASREYAVTGVVGIAPLQQYLVETEPGRLQVPDVAWDTERRRWFNLYPDESIPPGDSLHWTGSYKNWNSRCAECHATGYRKNYDARTRRYADSQAELGVGCESCHGPGSTHVDRAKRTPSETTPGLTIRYTPDNAAGEIETCAVCHSRREAFGTATPPAGAAFHDHYRVRLLDDPVYHTDGQIRADHEVYEYGSFLQSRMYAAGVRCSDCHDPHDGNLRRAGNSTCTHCHAPAGNAKFPQLRKAAYDTPEHHHHQRGSTGAECRSCHMRTETYMQLDVRHDHSFRIPRPDLSARLGTPNACTDCHADKTSDWAASAIATWFPEDTHRREHFATSFAAARRGTGGSNPALRALITDETLPAIVRATALTLFDNSTSGAAPDFAAAEAAAALLRHPDPLLRAAAVTPQLMLSPAMRLPRLLPLLHDDLRGVRLAATRALLDLPAGGLAQATATATEAALIDYRTALAANADFPESQMAFGGVALVRREFDAAAAAFAEATRLDPQLIAGWVMQVRIQAALGRSDLARETLRRALAANPGNSELSRLEIPR